MVTSRGPLGAGYEAVLRSSELPGAQLDLDGVLVVANEALGDLVGSAPGDLLGRAMTAVVIEEDRYRVAGWLAAVRDGHHRSGRTRLAGARPAGVPVHLSLVPVSLDDDLVAIHVRIVPLDGEYGLVNIRLEELFRASPIGLSITDVDGYVEAVNPVLCDLLGRSEEQLRERTFWDLTHPDDLEATEESWRAVVRGERASYRIDKRYLRADGEAVPVRVTATVSRDERGQVTGTVATVEDLGARDREEREAASARSLLRLASRVARIAGWSLEVETAELRWSEDLHRLLGIDEVPTDLEGGLERFYPPSARPQVRDAVIGCIERGEPFDLEVPLRSGNGEWRWARLVGEAEREDGRTTRVVGAFQDVTARRRSDEEVQAAAARLREAWESTADGVLLLSPDWRFSYSNVRAAELLGVDREELLGEVIWERFPATRANGFRDRVEPALLRGENVHIEEAYFAPLDTWFEIDAYPTSEGFAVYFRDVGDERTAREQLAERGRRLTEQAALLDQAQDAIHVRDLDGTITFWNRGAERLYGWTAEEAVGRSLYDLLQVREGAAARAVREALDQGAWAGELHLLAKGDRELIVEVGLTLLRDDDGTPRSLLSIGTDVTSRRQVEQQLLRAQRLESIGTLAGGIAHDLNNVLSPILLATELLAEDEDDERRRELLATVHASAERGADMVRQVLSFARGIDGERRSVDLGAIVRDVLHIARETFPRQITVTCEVADALPAVDGDVTQLHQLLMNLVVNARDAVGRHGTLRLRADAVDLDATYLAAVPELTPGRHVRVEVVDDGTGMPPAVVDRIFEPFFTTKETGEGTGLGLSTSLAIAVSHGGTLQVESEPGTGTTVRLLLPVCESGAPDPEPAVGSEPLPAGTGELVVVVDDEAAVRRITREALGSAGYRVLEAADGAEAVGLVADHLGDVALVLTDVTMPVMGGAATVHALRELAPTVPVIAASGLHEQDDGRAGASVDADRFLAKPYSARTLLVAVRELLDEGRDR